MDTPVAFVDAPHDVQVAVAQVREWSRLTADFTLHEAAMMFMSYMVYAGGDVTDFDWLLIRGYCEVTDFEAFLTAHDELVAMSFVVNKW